MAKCKRCNRRGLFLKINRDGLCTKCSQYSAMLSDGKAISKALQKEFARDGLGKKIYREIKEHGNEPSFSADVNEAITRLAYRSLTSGERPETLAKELIKSVPELGYDVVYPAMRTKCGIASSAMTQFRALALGRSWYTWCTVKDERVRESHRFMEGVICNWDDPPNPQKLLDGSVGQLEHPGYAKECRCRARVVLSAEDISLPARVHIKDSIREVKSRAELHSLIKY